MMPLFLSVTLITFCKAGDRYIDHEVENGEEVYYEHLVKCPFLNMAKKMGISELPCDFICNYAVEVATRDKRGRWEIISRMGMVTKSVSLESESGRIRRQI